MPTLLNELEAISDVALVAGKEESAVFGGSLRSSFSSGDLGAILDTSADDTVVFGGGKVGSRIRLAGMCCEGAPFLRKWVIAEVVAAVGIFAEGGVVSKRGNVNRCPCARQYHVSISVNPQDQGNRMTYRSSISQQAEHQGDPCLVQEACLDQRWG